MGTSDLNSFCGTVAPGQKQTFLLTISCSQLQGKFWTSRLLLTNFFIVRTGACLGFFTKSVDIGHQRLKATDR